MSSTDRTAGLPVYAQSSTYGSSERIGYLPIYRDIELADGPYVIFIKDPTGDHILSPANKFTVEAEQNSLTVKIDSTSHADLLAKEFKGFNKDTKRQIIRTLTAFDITRETIKRDFDSKAAEAKGELLILKFEDPLFSNSEFAKRMDSMMYDLSSANYLGYLSRDFSNNMRILRLAIGI